jgi:hypothetical protein
VKKLIVALFIFCNIAYAGVAETWKCGSTTGRGQIKEVLVVATIYSDYKTGKINMAGIKYKAKYGYKNFERRWDFANTRYSFIIGRDGQARFYDFSEVKKGQIAQASMFMTCQKQVKKRKK